jgi:membrane-bound metal-dependent hydrolase YbcI (DUF457 family)
VDAASGKRLSIDFFHADVKHKEGMMAQAGIHGLIGTAVRKITPERQWLMLGIVLGSLLPDIDNLAVAAATIMKQPTEGLHRTFTHSLITAAVVAIIFYIVSKLTKQARWGNLGVGLGVGIVMHILLDLLIWFSGVAILWPIPSWISLWNGHTPVVWFDKLMLSTEFLFFALFFMGLAGTARKHSTDQEYLRKLRAWTWLQVALFVVFTALVYTMQKGFMTPYGLVYLLSLALAIAVTIRMRKTVEAV